MHPCGRRAGMLVVLQNSDVSTGHHHDLRRGRSYPQRVIGATGVTDALSEKRTLTWARAGL